MPNLRIVSPIAALIGTGAMIAFTIASISSGAAEHFTRTVSAGQTVQVHVYRAWGKYCATVLAVAKLSVHPQHGKVSHHLKPSRIPASRFGGVDHCYGRPTTGFAVIYRPSAGFRGTDTFTLELDWAVIRRRSTDTYTIIVK